MAMIGPLSERVKGAAFITIGTILILHQLGILRKGLDFYVVITIALYLVVIGFLKLDGTKKWQQFVSKDKE